MLRKFILSILCSGIFIAISYAQIDTTNNKKSSEEKSLEPEISDVLVYVPETKAVTKQVYSGNILFLTLNNPKEFLESKPMDSTKLILYINRVGINGIYTSYFSKLSIIEIKRKLLKLPKSIVIPFKFDRNKVTNELWDNLYKTSDWNSNNIDVRVSLGWEGMFPINTVSKVKDTVTVVFFDRKNYYLWFSLYLVFLVSFIFLGKLSTLLRDYPSRGSNPAGPYSLSQTQHAFWTLIVIGSFIYLALLTDQLDSLNSSVLYLLGISIATTGAASFIDYYKKTLPKDTESKDTETKTIETIKISTGFFKDILSDENGYSVQRMQTAMWNLVLGVYFISYVIRNKSMPVISEILLVLTGISSFAYVANKNVENKTKK